ncbi:putative hydrolase of the HAD superfamily [Hasllibacter halocynthiae]|uniref:Putative hydrolase of the HAD superfamily n=1 Tax=Hasllibacter halocynthiae TaxID=595589 RepID=A0A2T0X421_9RHOB|nr:HAD family hydrolase [Hasllibacter halocynthiae]PRY93689.1 putative hydrolase of the HAD superfamily [Hasllibacter halocynthiae]
MPLECFAFDADDTLWHNERFFRLTHATFFDLLKDHADPDHLGARLLEAERRNLGTYGYGIKAFTLCMIETALEVTEGRAPGPVIAEIVAAGREMLSHPIDLLPGAREAVETAAARGRAVMVTKGDLLDQERKLAQSGLGDLFDHVEIVSEKDPAVYARVFGAAAARTLMVGDSMRSDILPALAAGAFAAHVPQGVPWAIEHAEAPENHPRFRRAADLSGFPTLVDELDEVT